MLPRPSSQGGFTLVAEMVAGKWLAWWIVAAAAVSQIGQFEAEMSTDSFQLQGMSERGFLPALFNKRRCGLDWGLVVGWGGLVYLYVLFVQRREQEPAEGTVH